MSVEVHCPLLKAALLQVIARAERELALARAAVCGDEVESLQYAAGRFADVGRSIAWDGEVLERDLGKVEQHGYGDRTPEDLSL